MILQERKEIALFNAIISSTMAKEDQIYMGIITQTFEIGLHFKLYFSSCTFPDREVFT